MAPTILEPQSIASGARATADHIRSEWQNPATIVGLLLLVGGDIVGGALEQLSGGSYFTPVVYSFGWVTYAHKAFRNAIGLHRLLTPPKGGRKSYVIDADTGVRTRNRSFILERVLSDYDYWEPHEGKSYQTQQQSQPHQPQRPSNPKRANPHENALDSLPDTLRIVIYQAVKSPNLAFDRLCYSGILVALIQNGIAAIPCGLTGDWAVLLVTGVGTILAFLTGSLPQFGAEKFHARRNTTRTFALTRGSSEGGSRLVIVIRGVGQGIDLEDMAKGEELDASVVDRRRSRSSASAAATLWPWTRTATGAIAVCWILLLIMVSDLRGNSWYLVGIGFLGLVQNSFVAGSPRTPTARGLPLRFEGEIGGEGNDAAGALVDAEERYEGLGKALFRNLVEDVTAENLERMWSRLSRRGD
ncbi:MAG: hypothetical protein M1828_004713 [Chrysothrix sp. TS-e1954]|nr:MAG: hypothetical protein M1828_004713 [Chrysothrix sp. TS-e1954]